MLRLLGLGCFATSAVGNIVLATFAGSGPAVHSWREQNDPVMGGKSTGTFTVQGGLGIFDGEVVDVPFLKAPGFIKAQTVDSTPFPDISKCLAVDLTLQATGSYSGYRFSFGNAHAHGGKFFAYGYKSHFTPPVGSMGTVSIPIKNFTDYWDDATGEPIKTCQESGEYCPDTATLHDLKTMSVWAEGVKGKVHLEIKSIQASGCLSERSERGAGRTCPAVPKSAEECPLKNVSDQEFEPVCIQRSELAELQLRRCMPGEKAPYFRDAQGVFRCACCGAALWAPSQQFDQLPADRWPWPSLHSPPLDGPDGLPSVCHRGPGYGVQNRGPTTDLGLGAEGEVGCARCGAHLGDYFNSKDEGMDHYCINGVCMSPPGGKPGETCAPTVGAVSINV
mmetsp:Transcript_11053/g.25967  ORF Transcript_11053/g.25967 Transcript_11053/m.25967 type:complete len:392 (-) Transcript_11053:44-1219(-)